MRHIIGADDVEAAYDVQQRIVADRIALGATVVGRKIGLTSAAVQEQLGVDQPDFGVLFADMNMTGLEQIPFDGLLQPKAEAEIAFVLDRDLDGDDFSIATVYSAVKYAVAALEIVDSRITGWDLAIADTVADNASCGLFVLGDIPLSLNRFRPHEVEMTMYVDGHAASCGSGENCLGDPLNALAWLARTAAEHGEPLRGGQLVLSGALGPMVTIAPGMTIRAELGPLGEVTARFSERSIR